MDMGTKKSSFVNKMREQKGKRNVSARMKSSRKKGS